MDKQQDSGGKEIVPASNGGASGSGDAQALVVSSGVGQIRTGPRMPGDTVSFDEKLRKISEEVPAKVNNVSGSSAGAGSGDFHQYRAMRRWEQDRLARMDEDFKQKVAESEFEKRRLERLAAAEEKTAKKRAKRQKAKGKKKAKKGEPGAERHQEEDEHSDSDNEEVEHREKVQELQRTLD